MRGLIDGLENPHPLIAGLPGVYRQDELALRLTAAFDDALAPVVSTIDNLEAYLDPDLAPPDMLRWLATWVAYPVGETWPDDRARALVRRAVELYRWRGTVKGLRALLETYLGQSVEIVEPGGVSWSTTPGAGYAPPRNRADEPAGAARAKPARKGKGARAAREADAATPADGDESPTELVVRVRRGDGDRDRIDERQLDAFIRQAKPAHVPHRLEIGGP